MKSYKLNSPFRSFFYVLASFLVLSVLFSSCDEKEELSSDEISEYYPTSVGKYIIYRLDSLVFTNFGRTTEIHKYQVKHQVDAQILDNLGRPAYRVYASIRDSAGTLPWQQMGTFTITVMEDQIEVQEDNLRFIKLHMPVNDGFSWKGNRYLPTEPYSGQFAFFPDNDMEIWDYYYDGPPSSYTYDGRVYDEVLTVEEFNESFNVPVTSPNAVGYMIRSVERYAKGIGPVFRHYELWEYQPNTGGSGGPFNTGFGITMWMIDHN